MTSSRRQVLVGSLALATTWTVGTARAAESNPQPVVEALGAVREARGDVSKKLGELAQKEGKVVMKAELSPLSAAIGGMAEARDHLVREWRKWSRGKHEDVDEKLTKLASALDEYRSAVDAIPGGGILTQAMVKRLRRHDSSVGTLTNQIGDRIDELVGTA
jgi:hypothetical protein